MNIRCREGIWLGWLLGIVRSLLFKIDGGIAGIASDFSRVAMRLSSFKNPTTFDKYL